MRLDEIIHNNGKFALVGRNSQGKTYSLNEYYKKHKKTTIFIENESKADEALKTSTSSSPLVEWLERLLEIKKIQALVSQQIDSINLPDTFEGSNLNIKFKNVVSNYKGLISAEVETKSNQWSKPGSGETFLGELLLVEQMINQGKRNPIKCLIIDEPETFLHKNLYLKVTSILKRLSEKMTIIVSTHSSDFLSMFVDDFSEVILVKNGELAPLKRDEEYVSMVLNMEIYDEKRYSNMDSRTKKILENYDSYFQYFVKPVVIQCLFNQVVVLGEGVAEIALFDCMRKHYKDDAFSGWTDYFGLYGKYLMPAFVEIIRNMGIKVLSLFDLDSDKEQYPWQKAINSYLQDKSDDYLYFEKEIEVDLGLGKIDKKNKGVQSPLEIHMAYINRNPVLCELMECLANKVRKITG